MIGKIITILQGSRDARRQAKVQQKKTGDLIAELNGENEWGLCIEKRLDDKTKKESGECGRTSRSISISH